MGIIDQLAERKKICSNLQVEHEIIGEPECKVLYLVFYFILYFYLFLFYYLWFGSVNRPQEKQFGTSLITSFHTSQLTKTILPSPILFYKYKYILDQYLCPLAKIPVNYC